MGGSQHGLVRGFLPLAPSSRRCYAPEFGVECKLELDGSGSRFGPSLAVRARSGAAMGTRYPIRRPKLGCEMTATARPEREIVATARLEREMTATARPEAVMR